MMRAPLSQLTEACRNADLRRFAPWLLLLAGLSLANYTLYSRVQTLDARGREQTAVRELAQLAPRIESLIEESRRTLSERPDALLFSETADALKAIQNLAKQEAVRIKETKITGDLPLQKKGKSELKMKVSGTYHNLAKWLSGLENIAGLEIDAWTLSPSSVNEGLSCALEIKFGVFLQS